MFVKLGKSTVQYLANKFQFRFSTCLVVDEIVYLRGINNHERDQAPPSLLRGLFKISIKKKSVAIEEIHIKFIGEAKNVVYKCDPSKRRFTTSNQKHIVNDSYSYKALSSALFKGTYTFPFQFTIDPNVSESLGSFLGSRCYRVEVDLKFPNEVKLKTIIVRPITLIRCPLEISMIPFESIDSIGNWKNVMSYHLSIYSKALVLDDSLDLHLKTFPNPSNDDKVGIVSEIKIYFLQKTKCPKDSRQPISPFDNSEYVTITNKCLLKQEKTTKFYLKSRDKDAIYKPFDQIWRIKLAADHMPFNVYPYTSNLDLNSQDGQQLKISHFIQIRLTVKMIEQIDIKEEITKIKTTSSSSFIGSASSGSKKSMKLIHESSELIFKAPIYLLDKLALEYKQPPPYKKGAPIETRTKSSAWLCTNGKLEVDKPPKY